MRACPVLFTLALVGCAAAPTRGVPDVAPTRRTATDVEIGGSGYFSVEQTVQDDIVATTISGTPDQHWAALARVYADLGIGPNAVDPGARVVGAQSLRLRRIGGTRPGAYLDCGAGPAGPSANQYDVYLTATTQLLAAEQGTEVRTRVEAYAKNPAHGNNPVRCTSKHALEREIAEALAARSGAGS